MIIFLIKNIKVSFWSYNVTNSKFQLLFIYSTNMI